MTIRYEPAEPKPVEREAVIVDGRPIGTIWKMQHGIQCSLKTLEGFHMGGIGKTKEEALGKAILSARKEAESLTRAADELEAALAKGGAE